MNGTRRRFALRRVPGALPSGATVGARAMTLTWPVPRLAPVPHLATAPVLIRRDRRSEPRLRV